MSVEATDGLLHSLYESSFVEGPATCPSHRSPSVHIFIQKWILMTKSERDGDQRGAWRRWDLLLYLYHKLEILERWERNYCGLSPPAPLALTGFVGKIQMREALCLVSALIQRKGRVKRKLSFWFHLLLGSGTRIRFGRRGICKWLWNCLLSFLRSSSLKSRQRIWEMS